MTTLYIIMGQSPYSTEEVDSAESMLEARRLLNEYRLAFGADWRLWIVTRRIP